MKIYTIGFTQKTAQQFFESIRAHNINLLIDIRLNNVSQLAGFSKGNDLNYFLNEICNCDYVHCVDFAPTKDILDNYKAKKITWNDYEEKYISLLENRKCLNEFLEKYNKYENICLLCSEPTAANCHRRLLAELILKKYPDVIITHI